MATNSKEDPKKETRPELVRLDWAYKLAEQWVNNMSKPKSSGKDYQLPEPRPPRLGIGATLPEESKIIRSNNPVERKLFANLNASKRKASARDEHLEPSTKDEKVDEESDEDETESKAKAFTKKNPPSLTSSLHAKKKKKRG